MEVRMEDGPMDRLTRMANEINAAIEGHPEYKEGDRAVVMMYDEGDNGGIGFFGYDEPGDAIVDIFVHLTAIFEAHGKSLSIIPLSARGQG